MAELGTRLANELTIDSDDRDLRQTVADGGRSFLIGCLISGIVQTAGNISGSVRQDSAVARGFVPAFVWNESGKNNYPPGAAAPGG